MEKAHFDSDYMAGCATEILNALEKTNMENTVGYGHDVYCDNAKKIISKICNLSEKSEIKFFVGGTITNATIIDSLIPPYLGILSPSGGHILVHEAGAIEAFGRKIITMNSQMGKVDQDELEYILNKFSKDPTPEHITRPGMLYISQPTEYGTLYSKSDLTAIRDICKKYSILLYIDGARLPYALCSKQNDLALSDIARLCDAFYIGGTKCGTLFGEAAIFPNGKSAQAISANIKRHGALLAKGRLLGVQFEAFFKNGYYLSICKNAVKYAQDIKTVFLNNGFYIPYPVESNQIFVKLTEAEAMRIGKTCTFEKWERITDETSLFRFVTSWSTREEEVKTLINAIGEAKKAKVKNLPNFAGVN